MNPLLRQMRHSCSCLVQVNASPTELVETGQMWCQSKWVHMSARSAKEARSQKGVRTVRNSDAILLLRALDANGGLLDGGRPILWLVIARVFRIGKVHKPNCAGTTPAEVRPCAFARKLAWRDAPSRSWNFIDSVISCFKSHAESSSSSLRVRPCAP